MKKINLLPALLLFVACSNPKLEPPTPPPAPSTQEPTEAQAPAPPPAPTPEVPASKLPVVKFVPPPPPKPETKPKGIELKNPSDGDEGNDNVSDAPTKPAPSFAPDETEIYQVVDNAPEYPGGNEAMIKFLSSNMKYPVMAKEAGVQGLVVVSFVIEMDGRVGKAQVSKDIGSGCGAEAVRLVKLMPKWTPGKLKGKVVRTSLNLPVKFQLED